MHDTAAAAAKQRLKYRLQDNAGLKISLVLVKLNFRQDNHIFSPNVLWTSKKFTDSLFFLDKDKLFGNRTSKNFDVPARGTSENL